MIQIENANPDDAQQTAPITLQTASPRHSPQQSAPDPMFWIFALLPILYLAVTTSICLRKIKHKPRAAKIKLFVLLAAPLLVVYAVLFGLYFWAAGNYQF